MDLSQGVKMDSGYVPTEDGRFISTKLMHVVEIIRDYDPALDVRWIPPDKRNGTENEYCVVETRNGRDHVVFYVKNESEMDERILARIFKSDVNRGFGLSDLDAHNQAVKLMQAKSAMEEAEEMVEMSKWLWKTPLNTIRHDGRRWDLPGAPEENRKTLIV